MHIKPIHATLALLAAWLFLTNAYDPNNPPVGRTGAPGETTCGASGCHSGGAFTGTVSISGVPDTVVPNQTYMVTLTNTSTGPTRAGFELTCLDNANAKCGTLTAGTGVSIGTNNQNGRSYARQSSPKNFASGAVSWTFSWKAPATASGGLCKFYFVSLCANGNGQKTGDNPLTASKSVVLRTVSPVQEAPEAAATWVDFQANLSSEALTINLLQANRGHLEVFDMQGRLLLETDLSAENQVPTAGLPAGMLVAKIAAGGKVASVKFMQD